ncbi:LysR family transcriptional regulator [Vibrio sp. WXL210]|uniref:LysR family transcriptional regulator n=1 Tax=Vibrio sp. WXL210 TaxID=3450709 RepID=UPI003EC794DD
MDLQQYDLNLLKTLSVLLQEQSVSKAAERLGTSQPSVSRALKKMRDEFEDPLFARHATGLTLTPRGEELSQSLPHVMSQIEQLFQRQSFEPSSWNGSFKLAVNNSLIDTFGHKICSAIHTHSPDVEFELHVYDSSTPSKIDRGEIDAAIHYFPLDISKTFRQVIIGEVSFGCLCRAGHRYAGQSVPVQTLMEEDVGGLIVENINTHKMTVSDFVEPEQGFKPKMRSRHLQPLLKMALESDLIIVAPLCVYDELDPTQFATITVEEIPADFPHLTRQLAFIHSNAVSHSQKFNWLTHIMDDIFPPKLVRSNRGRK